MLKALLKRMRSNEDGFTLVELLVVIVILGVLMGIGVPTYRGFIDRSHETATKSELSAVSNTIKYYGIEHGIVGGTGTLDLNALHSYLGDDLNNANGEFLENYILKVVDKTVEDKSTFSHIQATPTGEKKAERHYAIITEDGVYTSKSDGKVTPSPDGNWNPKLPAEIVWE